VTGGIRFFSAGPLSVIAIILLIGLVIVLIPLLVLGIIGAAFTRLGLSWVAALALVLLMLSGSFVNIPLYLIRRDMVRATPIDGNGNALRSSPWPATPVWDTRISINLGGGVIPVCIAVYMAYQAVVLAGTALLIPSGVCAGFVAVMTFVATREVAGLGIRVPIFLPALTALLAGYFLSGGAGLTAAVTALCGGVIGTLAGGNLAHLYRVRDLEVTDVSIGGYGTFGAVFLCCILPALVA
jgi:uncharacterized membrane protein